MSTQIIDHTYQVEEGAADFLLPHGAYDSHGLPVALIFKAQKKSQTLQFGTDYHYEQVEDEQWIRVVRVPGGKGKLIVQYAEGSTVILPEGEPEPPEPEPGPPPDWTPPPAIAPQMSLGWSHLPGAADLKDFRPWASDSVWNQKVLDMPADPDSATWMTAMGGDSGICLKAVAPYSITDGWGDAWEGLLYCVVDRNTPRVPVFVDADSLPEGAAQPEAYPGEKDPFWMPCELPPFIQGCHGTGGGYNGPGDKHLLVLDRDEGFCYETWNTFWTNDGAIHCGMAACFDLTGQDRQRPWFWSSASVSGMSYFAGIVRPHEITRGFIDHAIAFTAYGGWGRKGCQGGATQHQYSGGDVLDKAPMGARMRLKQSFDVSGFSPQSQIILKGLKEYGAIYVDGGHPVDLICGTSNVWDWGDISQIYHVRVSSADFEFVQAGPIYSARPGWTKPPDGPAPTIDSFTLEDGILRWQVRDAGCTFLVPDWGPVRGDSLPVPDPNKAYSLMAQNCNGKTTAPNPNSDERIVWLAKYAWTRRVPGAPPHRIRA